MNKMTVCITLFLAALLILPIGAAHAFSISYDVTAFGSDLDGDGSLADDLLYTFYLSDGAFNANEGFTVSFDLGIFDALEDFGFWGIDIGTDWNVLTFPPDPSIPDGGSYDALALVDNASLAGPFTVGASLENAAGSGLVGLPFETYQLVEDPQQPGFFLTNPTGQGQAAPIPEPGTLLLLGTGLMGAAGAVRRRRLHG